LIYEQLKCKFSLGFLKTEQICNFLISVETNFNQYIRYLPHLFTNTNSYPFIQMNYKPKSGDFFIMENKRNRHWRMDHHSYLKRKNSPKYNDIRN